MLSEQQIERYSRQIILPHVGGRGQEKLLCASVAVVGVGAAGSAAATYLAAAGIGHLAIGDQPTALAADLEALNPDCRVRLLSMRAAEDLTEAGQDVVIAAGTSDDTSRLLNAACVALGRPLVWGSVAGACGYVTAFAGHRSDAPCYRCVQCESASPPDHGALLSSMSAAFIGTLLATSTLTYILNADTLPTGRLLVFDTFDGTFLEAPIHKDPRCATCSAVTGMRT